MNNYGRSEVWDCGCYDSESLFLKCLRVSFYPYSMYFKVTDVVGTALCSTNQARSMALNVSKEYIEYEDNV